MLSARRSAQFGLFAVGLVLVASIGVLWARGHAPVALDGPRPAALIALTNLDGRACSLDSYAGRVVVLWFGDIRCPVNNRYLSRVSALARHFGDRGNVRLIGLQVGAKDSPDAVAVQMRTAGLDIPFWMDRTGSTAAAYGVSKTPTFVVIDPAGMIRYQGAFDDDESGKSIKHSHVREAIDAVLAGEPVADPRTVVAGCGVDGK